MLIRLLCVGMVLGVLQPSRVNAQETAVRWWEPYSGAAATGSDVLGLWKFDGDETSFTGDSSSLKHPGKLQGAKQCPHGRFGECLESAVGYPVADTSHALHVSHSPILSPDGAFTVEMWIRAKDTADFPKTYAPVLMDMKYVPGNHTGFMLTLTPASSTGTRQLALEIGTGTASFHWYSLPFQLDAEVWQHVAFTYDSAGSVEFFVDGAATGRTTKAAVAGMATAVRELTIGDRLGSLYRGFPGSIDEVRITRGIREFRPVKFIPELDRFVFRRLANDAVLAAQLVNQTGETLRGAKASARMPDGSTQPIAVPDLAVGGTHSIKVNVDTSLRPGEYFVELSATLPKWGSSDREYQSTTRIPIVIVRRPLPDQMPVIMWGIGGTAEVIKEIPRLKQIGFTHCLGLRCDYQKIWDSGADAFPDSEENIREGREMLNQALENELQIVATLSPGSWLRTADVGKPFHRVDRSGKHYLRDDISGLFPQVQDFVFNTGTAMSRAYGAHPALSAALLHSEVRDDSQVSFLPIDKETYREATGEEIPDEVTNKNGIQWEKIAGFPKNRVIADDDPILKFLKWFWQKGDGWNELHSRLNDGLKQHAHVGFWTFYDPAVRQPSVSSSGGNADVLSHWTYSYPDPVRIGLCTDELLEMARAGNHQQDVMKMTQLIWYRSQTAPKIALTEKHTSPWVDQDPDADYITIAPMHLRETFWWKLSRPIKGIMFHGWQSLVEIDSPSGYGYTNPNTQHELQRLIHDVIRPLGPTLIQIPDAPSDVAFLESFTSQMFARRGTFGWNQGWAGDMYHLLMYAQLQPRVLYEESLLSGDLKDAKVLVMADCDVLTESVVREIQEFQKNGGLIVGDDEICPAIKPDFVLSRFSRTAQADKDRDAIQGAAKRLRTWIDPKYSRVVDSSNSDVVTRRRAFGTTDYVFAVNDHREFGTYVGGYGMVMEDGLPSTTIIRIDRESGYVYDLVGGRELLPIAQADSLQVPLQLGPCQGSVLMVTERPIREISIQAPSIARHSEAIRVTIEITDGDSPIDALIPVQVDIVDPEGRTAEFSGSYAAKRGQLVIPFDFASNDRIGVWEIRAKELATGKSAFAYVRLKAVGN